MIPCRIIDCDEVGIEIVEEMDKSEVIRTLMKAWETVPEWRLGQLLYFLSSLEEGVDIYEMSDEQFVESCKSLLEENDLSNIIPLHQPRTKYEYLQECKKTLDEGDYLDVLCGIHEIEFYAAMENDLRKIVDTYFSYAR